MLFAENPAEMARVRKARNFRNRTQFHAGTFQQTDHVVHPQIGKEFALRQTPLTRPSAEAGL